jgi:hypothetical protein
VASQELRRASRGDDLAITERVGAGHVIQMSMAEDDRPGADAAAAKMVANEASVLQRDVGVIDQGITAGDEGVAGDPQRQRAFVDPVVPRREPIALDRPS